MADRSSMPHFGAAGLPPERQMDAQDALPPPLFFERARAGAQQVVQRDHAHQFAASARSTTGKRVRPVSAMR